MSTSFYVQKDNNGQWWCVAPEDWFTSASMTVHKTPNARSCTVDLAVIALLDLAGKGVVVPGIGRRCSYRPDIFIYLLHADHVTIGDGHPTTPRGEQQ